MTYAAIMLGALAIDAIIGWPDRVYRYIRHPVVWLGFVITWLERKTNISAASFSSRRLAGVVTAILVILSAAFLGAALQAMLPSGWPGVIAGSVLAWPLIAFRSLKDHVDAVHLPLEAGNLVAARGEVAKIVGRDPAELDSNGVARAALESLAENTSDGVIAPLFWGAVGGLPGLFAYKAINTLDSMIGYRTERYAAFGWAAARIDDVANFVPARLTALLFVAVSGQPRLALGATMKDARLHRSPNAGWPEAAMAGALGVRLSGPRSYHGQLTEDPWVNDGFPDPTAACLKRGLNVYARAMALAAILLGALAFM